MHIRFGVIVAEDQDGFHAVVPGLEDCAVTAEDLETMRRRLQTAIEAHLQGLPPATIRWRGLEPARAPSSRRRRWLGRARDLGRRLLLVS